MKNSVDAKETERETPNGYIMKEMSVYEAEYRVWRQAECPKTIDE
jgi:hypothetical protein